MMRAVDEPTAIRIEPMTADDWPAVRQIYQEGIATGDATLEREAPDWLGGGDIFLDDGPEDRLRTVVQGAERAADSTRQTRSPAVVSTR